MRSPGCVLLALLVGVACDGGPSSDRLAATKGIRIVLVTLDTWRGDELSPESMPKLAARAEEGLVFTQHYASSTTTQPTHASLLTGAPPWIHGVTRNGDVLAPEQITLAEHLAGLGFSTHAVVASFPLHERFGFAQGFDRYEDDFDVPYIRVWAGEETEGGRFFSLADSVTDRALAALDAASGDRQFFWFHYFDPHDPYGDTAGEPKPIGDLMRLAAERSPEIDAAFEEARSRYRDDLRALDRALDRLLARLASEEDAFETHVALTSDHGESFGELGAIGHGKRLSREQVHVPLVLLSPAVAGGLRDDAGGSADVARTLLALAGQPPGPLGGRDLLGDPPAEATSGMRQLYGPEEPELMADGTLRPLPEHWFFVIRDGRILSGNAELVVEGDDLARPLSDPRARTAANAFSQWSAQLEARPPAEELSPEVQEGLRALGYGQ